MKRIELEGTMEMLEDVQRLNEATIDYVCNFIDAPAHMWRDADPLTKLSFRRWLLRVVLIRHQERKIWNHWSNTIERQQKRPFKV